MCPITKSAKKALRQNPKRKARNIQRKKKIKSLIKKAQGLIDENKPAEAKKLLPDIYKALDKAAKKNTIKKNAASRKKSRISKLIKKSEKK
jgi:small subunit ribosomal protein S20